MEGYLQCRSVNDGDAEERKRKQKRGAKIWESISARLTRFAGNVTRFSFTMFSVGTDIQIANWCRLQLRDLARSQMPVYISVRRIAGCWIATDLGIIILKLVLTINLERHVPTQSGPIVVCYAEKMIMLFQ